MKNLPTILIGALCIIFFIPVLFGLAWMTLFFYDDMHAKYGPDWAAAAIMACVFVLGIGVVVTVGVAIHMADKKKGN